MTTKVDGGRGLSPVVKVRVVFNLVASIVHHRSNLRAGLLASCFRSSVATELVHILFAAHS